ncbi:Proteasome subunit beta type-5, partial [Fragariocoptes setiger]
MALEALLGYEDGTSFGSKNYRGMATDNNPLFVNEMDNDGMIKTELPMMMSSKHFTLSDGIIDEASGKRISIKFDKGTTTAAFRYQGGIVVCADSRATGGQYIGSSSVKKIIEINKFLLGTMAGGAADCVYWERVLSERCRLHELRNRQPISVAAASKLLSNMLYNYKGMGLSLGVMICGWDFRRGPAIYFVDNDGRRQIGNLFSVGSGSPYAYGVLDQGYRYEMTDEEAFDLGRRAIYHATHRDAFSGGIVRVYTINKDGWRIISEDDNSVLHERYVTEGSVSMNH